MRVNAAWDRVPKKVKDINESQLLPYVDIMFELISFAFFVFEKIDYAAKLLNYQPFKTF